jgi:hypothetical protein
MMHCVQCDCPRKVRVLEQQALCPKCCACFDSLVSLPADTDTESVKHILTEDPSLYPPLPVT